MPAIYSPEWQEALASIINAREDLAAQAPQQQLIILVHEDGDGKSPYVPKDEERLFLLDIDHGHVKYEEVSADATLPKLNFRFRAPATTFEEIAAGMLDPVDAGLTGRVKVGGDMRILMRYAELVKEVLGIYTSEIDTTWPLGSPPYDSQQGAAATESQGARA